MNNSIDSERRVDDGTRYTEQEIWIVILGLDNGKKDPIALLVQTLIKQNEMLMSMLVPKDKQPKVYSPPDMSKTLPTFNRNFKPHEVADWMSTLCGVAKLYRWFEALKLESARVNIDGPA